LDIITVLFLFDLRSLLFFVAIVCRMCVWWCISSDIQPKFQLLCSWQ